MPHVPSPTGLFISTKRHSRIHDAIAVDPDGAGTKLGRNSVSLGDVTGPHPGGEAVGCVVRFRDEVIDTHGAFRSMVHEGEIVIPRVSLGEPLRSECDHFLDCVLQGTSPHTGAAAAVDVVRALDAIDRSMRLGGARVSVLA